MKRIMLIIMIFVVSSFAITISLQKGLSTVEDALTGINSQSYDALQDTIGVMFERHINSTTYHHLADTQTDSTLGSSESLRGSIVRLNNWIENMGVHFALDTLTADSVHFETDTLNVSALSLTANYTSFEDRLHSSILNYNTHCAKDTSDFTDVHISASVDTISNFYATSNLSLPNYSALTLSATSSGTSTGATMFIDVSQDDITYVHLDSMAISTNTVTYKHITNLYKYMKFYCKYYTDGEYKLQIQTGGE